jgi:hypothetical protein
MGNSFEWVRKLCWNIPCELCVKLIFERLTESDMMAIIEAEKGNYACNN